MHPALRYSYKIVDRVAPLQAFADKLLAWSREHGGSQSSSSSSSSYSNSSSGAPLAPPLLDVACDIEALVRPIEANAPKQLGSISLIQLCAPAVEPTVSIIDVLSLGTEQVHSALAPILEGREYRKIMFDLRRDVEALSSQLRIQPRRVLDLQLMYTGNQWKQRASDRRSGLQYVLKQELGLERQAGDAAVSKAMLLGNRPVWDVRPLPEHFLEYAADDVRHLCALFDTMKLRHGALMDASERISEEYCGFYARADCKPVEAEADTKSQNVRTEWLERYFGPAGVCGFCGARGHHEAQCFRKAAAGGGANIAAAGAAASSASSASATAVKDEASVATTPTTTSPPSSGKSVLRCSHCGGLGHLSTSCFKKNPALLKCTHCGQMGHVATHCFVKNPCPHCGGKHKPEKCLKRALLSPEEQDQQQQPRS